MPPKSSNLPLIDSKSSKGKEKASAETSKMVHMRDKSSTNHSQSSQASKGKPVPPGTWILPDIDEMLGCISDEEDNVRREHEEESREHDDTPIRGSSIP